MRLNEVVFTDAKPVEGYSAEGFRVGGEIIRSDVLCAPDGVRAWGGWEDIDALLALAGQVDVLFLGTGAEIAHPPAGVRAALEEAALGIEVAATAPACRTYNVLLSEGRRVALAAFAGGVSAMLTVRDLAVGRGGLAVLEALDFDVAAGEAVIVRGPNGSGKTTLLRTLAGLQPPLAGTIAGAEDDIAYAAHADGLKSTLSVQENLTFWAAVFGTRDAEAAIEAFDLGALRDRPAGQLSAGQKRRLGLARMVVTGRSIWIFDEPTVSLDTRAVAMFADVVRGHLAQGGAAIVATHIDLGLAGRVFDVTPFKASPATLSDFDEAFQ